MGVQITTPGGRGYVSGSAASQASITSPGAGGNASGTIAAANLPAGLYEVTVVAYIDGTVAAATDDDNLKINQSAGAQTHLAVPSNGQVSTTRMILAFTGSQTISVQVIAAGTAGSVYHASITCNLLA